MILYIDLFQNVNELYIEVLEHLSKKNDGYVGRWSRKANEFWTFILYFNTIIYKIGGGGRKILPKLVEKARITLSKPDKDITRKENYRPMSL